MHNNLYQNNDVSSIFKLSQNFGIIYVIDGNQLKAKWWKHGLEYIQRYLDTQWHANQTLTNLPK
jgi:hypothetical protein